MDKYRCTVLYASSDSCLVHRYVYGFSILCLIHDFFRNGAEVGDATERQFVCGFLRQPSAHGYVGQSGCFRPKLSAKIVSLDVTVAYSATRSASRTDAAHLCRFAKVHILIPSTIDIAT
jgi:hypothetical protein